MINFWLAAICLHCEALTRNIMGLEAEASAGGGSRVLSEEDLWIFAHNVELTVDALENLGVPHAKLLGERLAARLRATEIPWNVLAAREAIGTFYNAFLQETTPHKWVRVDKRHAIYFENSKPFGEAVHERFPSARDDIRDAGYSLAVDLNTAAVFHAMRTAEAGLKWIARILKVKLIVNKKQVPVDEGTWQTIITAVNNEIKRLHQTKPSPKRRERLEAYAQAASHCDYMKDIWRNNVSHAHKSYGALEAEAAIQRVREFMQLLAGIA